MNTTTTQPAFERRNYAWGVGGVADNLLTFGLAWTVIPIFNIGYGVNAFWLGIAIFIPRVIDVITDPLMGVISDRTRSRFGRRRPYIFVGAIAMAALFALLWLPPFSAVTPSAPGEYAAGTIPPLPAGEGLYLLLWVAVVYTLVTLAYTVFSVPYIAMGYEFTRNYDIVTKVMSSRLYFTTLASFGVPWLYRLAVADRFGGDETVGMRSVGVLVAVVIVLTGVVPAIVCRPTYEAALSDSKPRASFRAVVAATLGNRAFVLVMTAMLVFVISLYTGGVMMTHINVFYVAGGNKQAGGHYAAISGNIIAVCTLLGMYPMTLLSRRTSKKVTCVFALALALASYASLWWTLNPRLPQLQYISAVFTGLGSSGIWLMLDSMIGDVIKDDEARTGAQREGIFGASKSFMFKIAVAATSITGALTLTLTGFQEGVAPSTHTLLNMRLAYVLIQCAGAALAIAALVYFPITRARAEANERRIESRA